MASRLTGVDLVLLDAGSEFCAERLLPYVFADADDERQQYTMVVHTVTARLARPAQPADGGITPRRLARPLATRSWSTYLRRAAQRRRHPLDLGGPRSASGTVNAFARRLHRQQARPGPLIRGDLRRTPRAQDRTAESAQVTVVDLHNLPDRAQRFVVGVTLKPSSSARRRRARPKPLLFVVLDELNKYAPREGSSPIKEVLLDIAERGRSLGVVLIGAQQTASEVERRIVANSAIRVVGRLDPAEAGRPEYGFLPPRAAPAGAAGQAGHDVRRPAGDPGAAAGGVPVPGLGDPALRGRCRGPGPGRTDGDPTPEQVAGGAGRRHLRPPAPV